MKIDENTKQRVYIDDINDNLEFALRAGLEYIKWDRFVHKNSKVFIKPNFTFPYYKEGVTTNPKLLEHLITILKSKADTVIIGESDGGNHSWKAQTAFKNHGMYEICQKNEVELVNLSELPSETVESKILSKHVKVELPRLLLEDVDCFISIPVLKVHSMTKISLSIKNLWGCVPNTMRVLEHQNLAYKLALIANLVKPKIAVIDGTYALNKHGPMYGEVIKTNLIIVADNPLAADVLGTKVMGFSPQRIEHLAIADKAGVGTMKIADTEVNKDWKQYEQHFELRRTFVDLATDVPFHSDMAAKIIYDSPLTPIIYKLVHVLRSPRETELANEVSKHGTVLRY